jgi:hypothetical protein
MKPSQIERIYGTAAHALFGACLTALGQMRAHIEHQDVERGTIVAVVGGGLLDPATELSLRIMPADAERARLVAVGKPRKRGGDPRVLTTLVQVVDRLLGQA